MTVFDYHNELVNILTEQLGPEEMLEQILKALNVELKIEILLYIARNNNVNVSKFVPNFE